ncbi:MAG TPA: hypothetical protein VHY08_06965 [Bacillota bacterium]|nr:hypothetical protein [Bacillota bacterium]
MARTLLSASWYEISLQIFLAPYTEQQKRRPGVLMKPFEEKEYHRSVPSFFCWRQKAMIRIIAF